MSYIDESIIQKKLLKQHNNNIIEYGENHILGTFVVGKANYGFAETEDEINFVTVYIPSFEEMCLTIYHKITEKGQNEIYDLRTIYTITTVEQFDSFLALELLFSDYSIITPKYYNIFKEYFYDKREELSRYNEQRRIEIAWSEINKAIKMKNNFEVARLYNAIVTYASGDLCENCFHIKNPVILSYLQSVKDGKTELDYNKILEEVKVLYDNASSDLSFSADETIKKGVIAFMAESLKNNISKEAFTDTLTKTELSAFEYILQKLNNNEGVISISKMIEETKISRPVFKNLLSKMEKSQIAEVRNQGVNGTYIKMN